MARDFAKAFYKSPEWQKVRMFVLMRDRFVCQRCGRPAQEVHHIIHLTKENITDVTISLNSKNLISLCKDCHFEQHIIDKREGFKKAVKAKSGDCADGFHFDENGQLVRD